MFRINRNKLKLAMLNAGIPHSKDLAAKAGVSVNTVSRIINGGGTKISTFGKLATALGVDPAEIIQEEGA